MINFDEEKDIYNIANSLIVEESFVNNRKSHLKHRTNFPYLSKDFQYKCHKYSKSDDWIRELRVLSEKQKSINDDIENQVNDDIENQVEQNLNKIENPTWLQVAQRVNYTPKNL